MPINSEECAGQTGVRGQGQHGEHRTPTPGEQHLHLLVLRRSAQRVAVIAGLQKRRIASLDPQRGDCLSVGTVVGYQHLVECQGSADSGRATGPLNSYSPFAEAAAEFGHSADLLPIYEFEVVASLSFTF